MTEVQKWADAHMFSAEPMTSTTPKVHLISMTPDPLGAMAAAIAMYKGRVVRSTAEITDAERADALEQMTKTTLNAGLEVIDFHFLLEGVNRAFTHQLVRQRTAVYFQESMRFAVIDESFADRVSLPPSLMGTTGTETHGAEDSRPEWMRNVWDDAISHVEEAYKHLVDAGMPAEEARGLLPTDVLTRIHYKTNLRNLVQHAGLRLCTQAQFHWRLVFAGIADAIRNARVEFPIEMSNGEVDYGTYPVHMSNLIADRLFKPICYQEGKCAFMADFDRDCTIRERVQANAAIGRPSSEWGEEWHNGVRGIAKAHGGVGYDTEGAPAFIGSIMPREWLADPTAARG